jgi:hypothetical protein
MFGVATALRFWPVMGIKFGSGRAHANLDHFESLRPIEALAHFRFIFDIFCCLKFIFP